MRLEKSSGPAKIPWGPGDATEELATIPSKEKLASHTPASTHPSPHKCTHSQRTQTPSGSATQPHTQTHSQNHTREHRQPHSLSNSSKCTHVTRPPQTQATHTHFTVPYRFIHTSAQGPAPRHRHTFFHEVTDDAQSYRATITNSQLLQLTSQTGSHTHSPAEAGIFAVREDPVHTHEFPITCTHMNTAFTSTIIQLTPARLTHTSVPHTTQLPPHRHKQKYTCLQPHI